MIEPLIPTSTTICLDTSQINYAAHTRIGVARIEAELDLPIGYDKFGYSYIDNDGRKYHDGYRQDFGFPYYIGDVIGCLIKLKPPKPIRIGEEKKQFEKSMGSEVHMFRNGTHEGVAFADIYEGTYFPAVSLYNHARVELNLTGSLKYPEVLTEYSARPFSKQ
jgi:Set1/Ash2 histone methyltransferase complex subunit ASH2